MPFTASQISPSASPDPSPMAVRWGVPFDDVQSLPRFLLASAHRMPPHRRYSEEYCSGLARQGYLVLPEPHRKPFLPRERPAEQEYLVLPERDRMSFAAGLPLERHHFPIGGLIANDVSASITARNCSCGNNSIARRAVRCTFYGLAFGTGAAFCCGPVSELWIPIAVTPAYPQARSSRDIARPSCLNISDQVRGDGRRRFLPIVLRTLQSVPESIVGQYFIHDLQMRSCSARLLLRKFMYSLRTGTRAAWKEEKFASFAAFLRIQFNGQFVGGCPLGHASPP